MSIAWILALLALICFAAQTFKVTTPIDLTALGLALLTLTLLI